MTLSFLYLYLCSLFLSITAANDWNKPCFSGVCEYDLPSTNGRSSGTITIWGPSGSIGDITPAAGWAILSCSPESLKQTIRIACMDEGSSDCAHLFGNTTNLDDAVGKVVRLPETCGKNAFGIVTKATLHEDQSIPDNMISSLTRRDGTLPTVHGLHITTNPNAAEGRAGGQQVRFAIRAANIPGAAGDLPQKDTSIQGRGLPSFVKHAIHEIKSLIQVINDFNTNDSVTLPPVDINKNFTVLNESISCPTFREGLSIHVNTTSHAVLTVGVAATGTIVPPKVDSISITGSITAKIDAIVDVSGNVGGTFDLPMIKLFEAGIPGLDFPGILSIGPSIEIAAMATASLDAEVDMKIGINYDINQTSFTFPQQHEPGGGSFKICDTPLNVNITPNSVNATGSVAVHLIPSLIFGIATFGGQVDNNVFVNVDASVSATLGITDTEQTKQLPRAEPMGPSLRLARRESDWADEPSVVTRADSDLPPTSLDGCFQANAGLSVNIGADTDFFNLFNVTTQISLYNQTFRLYKKCYGSTSPKPSSNIHPRGLNLNPKKKRSFNLQCLPFSSSSNPITIVNTILPASSFTKNLDY